VKADFQARKREISRYIKFVDEIAREKLTIVDSRSKDNVYDSGVQSELIKTLKASAFLLLYNLLESTLKNSIEAIFDELQGKGVNFDSCRDELRHVVLGNLKRRNIDDVVPDISRIATDLISVTFRKDTLFSGNVDGRLVRATAKEYGFHAPRRSSDELLVVKSNRNDLAHGNKTFSEVGREYDMRRVKRITKEVFHYLSELIDNVDTYLENEHYLHAKKP
jgi:hypothetical protein